MIEEYRTTLELLDESFPEDKFFQDVLNRYGKQAAQAREEAPEEPAAAEPTE